MDIDFLPDEEKKNKPSREQKKKKDLGEEVKWSSPEKEKKSLKLSGEKKGIKSYLPDFFNANFLRRKKEKAGAVYPNNLADRNKLRQSRKELLKLIGEQKKAASYSPTADKAKEVNPVRNSSGAFPPEAPACPVGRDQSLVENSAGIILKSQPARPAKGEAPPVGGPREVGQPLDDNPAQKQRGIISTPVRNNFPSPVRSKTSNGISGANGVKISPTKKKRLEIRPKIAKLFKPIVAVFKKFGKKLKANGGRKEEKEQGQKPPLENKEESNHRQDHLGSNRRNGAGGTGKEIAPEFVQAKEKEERNGGEILETNLIKDEITVFFDWRKNVAVFLIGIILSALAVGAAYGLISWQGGQKEKEGQYFIDRFSELDKEIARVEEEAKKVLVFKKKLSLVNSLLGQHVYWTNFFKFLEENTLADVYYSGFIGDNKGKYSLTANAKDFSIIQAQVERFLSGGYVSGASVLQAGISTAEKKESDTGEITFELKLVIDPAIFTPIK